MLQDNDHRIEFWKLHEHEHKFFDMFTFFVFTERRRVDAESKRWMSHKLNFFRSEYMNNLD